MAFLIGFTDHRTEKNNDYNHLKTGENDVNAMKNFLQKGPLNFDDSNILELIDPNKA